MADASVLIDLEMGGLLPVVSCLPFDLVTTDLVASEVEVPGSLALSDYGLRVESLSPAEIAQLGPLAARHSGGISSNDASGLYLAKKYRAILLAGERPLRAAAGSEGVEVHGTLWLLDRAVESILAPHAAADALERMLRKGSYLPDAPCRERIERWRGT